MTTNVATLVNLAGFITGALLYAMLLVMVLGASRITYVTDSASGEVPSRPARLPLLTAVLGLAWTFGAFMAYTLPNFGIEHSYPMAIALAFTALGFLPAVVVHSTLSGVHTAKQPKGAFGMIFLAYALSTLAGFMHIFQALVAKAILSHVALHILTVGFGVLIVGLLLLTRDQPGWRRAMWVIALSVFAVSAQHLSHHQSSNYPWWIELVGHHASLPLALAILYQDYRFALADIFLKRALALILLVALTLGVYATMAPLLAVTDENADVNPQAVGLLLVMWVATVLLYPALRRAVDRFVDAKILRRADYTQLRAEIAHLVTLHDAPETMLNEVCERLASALTAREVRWLSPGEVDDKGISENGSQSLLPIIEHPGTAQNFLTNALARATSAAFQEGDPATQKRTKWYRSSGALAILVPTVESPRYLLVIGELTGGRRLLSDDMALLEAVAFLVARRIDVVRVKHERCERNLREQEIGKLATEAEFRALRAQINPHFLFNALTTIGYLIQTSPDRALSTLMRLGGLLRGVLKRSAGEFATLGEEVDLIESYLDVELARFEERLRVMIDVPYPVRELLVPSLLLQPIVENAIKHGIAPRKAGGTVVVEARLAPGASDESSLADRLYLWVRDTGAGASDKELARGRARGVGLNNLERRLQCIYGGSASISLTSTPGAGTTVEIQLPVNAQNGSVTETVRATAQSEDSRHER
jgi:signal transduction histidine kinase